MNKRIYKTLVIIIAIALVFTLVACNDTTSEIEKLSYVSIKINPEVDFIVNGNIVEAVYAANEDAEIVLSDVDLTGMEIDDAIEEFIEIATEVGYIDDESTENEVEIGVIGEGNEQLAKRLKERINKYFNNNGIFGRIKEETLSLYGEQAAALGIPTGKMKMVLKALDLNPDLDINILKDMSTNELVALCRENVKENGMNATLMNQFKEQRSTIYEKYPTIQTLREEIEELEEQIENFVGTDEDKAALVSELALKQEEYKSLHEAYKAEIEAAKEELQAQKEQIKNEFKNQKKQKIKERIAKKGNRN